MVLRENICLTQLDGASGHVWTCAEHLTLTSLLRSDDKQLGETVTGLFLRPDVFMPFVLAGVLKK